MIVVDSSALIAVVLDETLAEACYARMAGQSGLLMSAGTLAEALIVAGRRGARAVVEGLVADLGIEIVPVTAAEAKQVADAYDRWGRGVHPAGLNYGDCFAYALAKGRNLPLLYVGDDFARTDVASAFD
jgi:ribonuclease VapC